MKKFNLSLLFFVALSFGMAQCTVGQSKSKESVRYVLIETEYGNMKVKLYNETPQHRDNFLKLVEQGYYDGLLFHRVIKQFMIQGGDPNSRETPAGTMLGDGNLGYTIPAEFRTELFHRKGALAAARLGDNVNPRKESSACQFYIVQGNVWKRDQLQMMEQRFGKQFSQEQMDVYSTEGGAPHLDGEYTVFGEVVEGLEVIDAIAQLPTDRADRPKEDVRMKISIIEQ